MMRNSGIQVTSRFFSHNKGLFRHRKIFEKVVHQQQLVICSRSFITNHPVTLNIKNVVNNLHEELVFDGGEDQKEIQDYNELVHRIQLLPDQGHQVFILQPFVKWGPKKKELTTPDLMLEEAKGLIESLPNWKYVEALKVPVETVEKKNVFGVGQIENLKKQIVRSSKVSAVFVSLNFLRGIQRKELVSAFGVPVFDRYSIVLQIFKERAKTKEAKLQVAFAEIPYLRSCLVGGEKMSAAVGTSEVTAGGLGESFYGRQLQLLERREMKIKKELESLSKKRGLLKKERRKRELPVVAIVGYTNAGKSTLIKSLTGDTKIEPRDALFATLDVTVHACRLPCNLTVLLTDTVGFISDIPTNLIAAFNSTLRDAMDADLILHVHDESHPDKLNQVATVDKTLEHLELETAKAVIRVANKIDKVDPKSKCSNADFNISALNGTGIDDLLEAIQSKVIEITKRFVVRLMVQNGGSEYRWIMKETVVVETVCSKNPDHLIMDILVTTSTFARLKSIFPNIKMCTKSRSTG